MNPKKIFWYIKEKPNSFIREIKSRVIYKNLCYLKKGVGFPIMNVYLMFTADCNLNCFFCSAPRKNRELEEKYVSYWRKNRLNFEEYKKFIDNISVCKPEITLTGGEPLICNDWYEVAKYIKSKKLNLSLQTNGILIKENVQEILDTVNILNVSIDGTEEIHDKVRGKEGAFKKVIEGIKLINKIKKENRPEIVIAYTINELNYNYLSETVENLLGNNIEFSGIAFQHLLFIDKEIFENYRKQYQNGEREVDLWLSLIYSPEGLDTDKLYTEIEKLKRKFYNKIWISFIPELNKKELRLWYNNPSHLLKRFNHHCFTPWMDLDICPDGDVRICIDYSLGNIRDKSILEIWQGERAKRLRMDILRKSPYPVCRACCNLYRY